MVLALLALTAVAGAAAVFFAAVSFQISEYYPWSGAERENRRRDMRGGEAAPQPSPATLLSWVFLCLGCWHNPSHHCKGQATITRVYH
jgi:hypothetical protein